MKDPHRQEIGYKLVGKLKRLKCSVIHEVNKFLSFSYSHHGYYIWKLF